MLDSLGKGSVIGMNFVIQGEQWMYKAMNPSTQTAKVIKISKNLLQKLRQKQSNVEEHLSQQEEYLQTHGLMQIDYVIDHHKILKTDLLMEQLTFQKYQLWRK